MLPRLAQLKGIALDFLFPRWCIGCGKEGGLICPACRRLLPRIMPRVCPRCGKPQSSGVLCASCAGSTAAIDGIRAPFRFDGVIRQAVHQLKYHNLTALAQPLAGLLRDYLAANPLPVEALVPVPLHPRRLKERGYNQSGLLARELGRLTNFPVVESGLIRHRQTLPQARTATLEERKRNIRDAFLCPDATLRDRQVLLIDDVSTSGATLDACAAVLKASGAVSVWGLTLAKEI